MTPNALWNERTVRTRRFLEVRLPDLPLNAELDAESASGELAECVRDDPEWDEYPDEEDANAKK